MSASEPKCPLHESYFQITCRGSTLRREILAGITTFLTMAYAFILVPTLLAQAGVDFGASMTATVIVALFATFMAGLFANYPFALAPGIALIVYFTYSLVQKEGMTWQIALGTSFLTGVGLWLLTAFRLRTLLIHTIPNSLRLATVAGIGIFLAIVGLKNAGILAQSSKILAFANPSLFVLSMVALGIFSIGILMRFGVYGAIFWGIIVVWIVSALLGKVTWAGVVSLPQSLTPTLFKLDVAGALKFENIGAFISMLFIALFDSTGAVLALGERAGLVREHEKGCHITDVHKIFICDSTSTMLGGILGTSPTAIYLESASGIGVGGRTGISAFVTGLLFCFLFFFSPFVTSIPLYATTPALVIVGGMMLTSIGSIKWKDVTEWIPAFLTLILIPLTFDVAFGIGVGYITFCALKLFTGKVKHVHWFTWIIAAVFILKFVLDF